ncbi:hypothetical protein GUITHDRAFT_154781 [Guillardia theta CCMP2712]|uniref:Uncharacterized protein n=2 Tax=Guillardia theta TaxID=55529 RepID=L1IQ02_GUITC|nr:hypothetical protein GUITHDRAFT_154781 [Guillardia theta CCMP2712]EKX38172.1 hypothetical protein GUITHDRAFT_154781 [Guillardia theta CCMP2712]|eukprot:XP_005825152.1 hypothetical protein GUITHDRAFT_154781 [Guillardia theta CCMP2712]
MRESSRTCVAPSLPIRACKLVTVACFFLVCFPARVELLVLKQSNVYKPSLTISQFESKCTAGSLVKRDGVDQLQRLRGGNGAKPDTKHAIIVGSVCALILILNEFNVLSAIVRVSLTLLLSLTFLLAGINKTNPTFHKPTHLFLANMFPDICNKVWKPIFEKALTSTCRFCCKYFSFLKNTCGQRDDGSFTLPKSISAMVTPASFMHSIGQVEVSCAMLMLISLAGTGSRGHRVPLAELSNVVLFFLMVGATYSHLVLMDGRWIPSAVLGLLLFVRFITPAPSRKGKSGKGKKQDK